MLPKPVLIVLTHVAVGAGFSDRRIAQPGSLKEGLAQDG
jgi:hypothetical protein